MLLVKPVKIDFKSITGGGLHYSFSASGDLGDNDVGFSYKPLSVPLRRELGNTASNVTNGIASGSIATGADGGSGGSEVGVSQDFYSGPYVKSLGKTVFNPSIPSTSRRCTGC